MAADAETAAQIVALEARAVRRMRATAKRTIAVLSPSGDVDLVAASLAASMTVTVRDIKTSTRITAAQQFTNATGITAEPSGVDDLAAAIRAGAVYTNAWRAAYLGAGGTTTGGGSGGAWDDARLAAHSKIDRIAAWEVMHAWNDEHRRNADALPQYKFIERWCAILDPYLCKRCRSMNGKRTDAYGTFAEGWPPLHGDCRCFIVTTLA